MFNQIIIEHADKKLFGHVSSDGHPRAWVIFAHGSGSSHQSPRNNWVAQQLNLLGFGTLLFDLLTPEEDFVYENRFNVPLLSDRLLVATQWLLKSSFYHQQPLAYFGASTGAAAAIVAAARSDSSWPLYTVISRGGRPDLAGREYLSAIHVPVLLIVGERDEEVLRLNERAENELSNVQLSIVPGATHLFEEPGSLDEVVEIAARWLGQQMPDDQLGSGSILSP